MNVHYSDVNEMIFTLCGYSDKYPTHAVMATTTIEQVTCLDCLQTLARR